jgi:uncharacterized protein (DUF1684 family)
MPVYYCSGILAALLLLTGCHAHRDSLSDETQRIDNWRQQRVATLTSENGWLTLAGLFWLKPGSNRFGRNANHELVLGTDNIDEDIATFELQDKTVRFTAASTSHVTAHDQAVKQLQLATDATDQPTLLATDSLRFYAIERAGRFGVRVRDINHPARKAFTGLSYFPVNIDWRIDAHYERYWPSKHIAIVNILGMTEQMESPGALVFTKDGQTWRIDSILESPTDTQLFVMFTDATSGRDTYGAGRYLYIRRPIGTQVWLDFNQAFNPPCAFTEFATCPLPPKQNRLALAVTAGEKKYQATH